MEPSVAMYDRAIGEQDTLWTWANLVTAIRTIGGLALFIAAYITRTLYSILPDWLCKGCSTEV